MNNIIFFPRKAVPLRPIASKDVARPVLVAVWHRNSIDGRLECHWKIEQAPDHGEGLRPGGPDRRAA